MSKLNQLNSSVPTRFLLAKPPQQRLYVGQANNGSALSFLSSTVKAAPLNKHYPLDIYNNNDSSRHNYSSYNHTLLVAGYGPEWKHPLLGFVLSLFSLTTIFGNTLVICAVVRERYLKSATNYYIVSLAVADLIVGLLVMPFNAINEMTNNFWFFGDVMCELWHAFDVFASTASINSLLIIALDRHSRHLGPHQLSRSLDDQTLAHIRCRHLGVLRMHLVSGDRLLAPRQHRVHD